MINQRDENGIPYGPWENYFINGKLYYKGVYKRGQQHGLWEQYYSYGIYSKGEYKNDKRRGLWHEPRYNS